MKPITTRLPTPGEDKQVWRWNASTNSWRATHYSHVCFGQPWLPIEPPPPYEPPREPGPCYWCGWATMVMDDEIVSVYVKCTNPQCNAEGPIARTAEAAIEAWEQLRQPTWQPIETAPKDDTPYLGWCPSDGVEIVHRRFSTPTHWQPLPEPPKLNLRDYPEM